SCTFTAILVSNDARGEEFRRRGVAGGIGLYGMLGEVKSVIDDAQFFVQGADRPEPLNIQPFRPVAVDYMAKLKDITAYAVHWDTVFKYVGIDRSPKLPLVRELVLDVASTGSLQGASPGAPGVLIGDGGSLI
ncbi:MAG TPA: hypothetical protein VI756_07255, partial [Blastocatellia bacterium]